MSSDSDGEADKEFAKSDTLDTNSADSVVHDEKVNEEIFKRVFQATAVYKRLTDQGFASFGELLATLNGGTTMVAGKKIDVPGYVCEGYNPACGTIIESLADDLNWEMCVVANTYETTNEDKEAMIALTTLTPHSKRLGCLEHGNDPDEVRPPRAAVVGVFGDAPDNWMKYQLIEAEKRMRFERFHCFDFEETDWKQWIGKRFEFWVGSRFDDEGETTLPLPKGQKDESNAAFQAYYAKQSAGAKHALFDYIVEPFEMIDAVVNNWFDDFDEPVSCYTYLSFLGMDWFFPIICLMIQIGTPLALGLSSLRDHVEKLRSDDNDDDSVLTGSAMCPQRKGDDVRGARFTLIAVLFFYLIKVVPDQIALIKNRFGVSADTRSKLNRLRSFVFLKRADGIAMKLGYRADMVMNSSYIAALYIFNIMVLLTYADPWDIILNSLAIEFIKDIDESFTSNVSYEEGEYRYLKAGIVETIIRRYVDIPFLNSKFYAHDGLKKHIDVVGTQASYEEPMEVSRELVEDLINTRLGDNSSILQEGEDIQKVKEDTQLYTAETKVHFYSLYTWLNNQEENLRDQNCILHFFVQVARWMLPGLWGASPIFNRWGRFRQNEGRMKTEWDKMLYPTPKDIKKVEARLELLQSITSIDEWEEVLEQTKEKSDEPHDFMFKLGQINFHIDEEDHGILKGIYSSCKMKVQSTSKFASELWGIYTFKRLWRELVATFEDGYLSFTDRFANMTFYTISALSEVFFTTLLILFPLIFTTVFFWAGICY